MFSTRAAIRVMIVEDHRIVREAVARLIEQEDGFELVGSAATPRAALEEALRTRPSVILMDMWLGTEAEAAGVDASTPSSRRRRLSRSLETETGRSCTDSWPPAAPAT